MPGVHDLGSIIAHDTLDFSKLDSTEALVFGERDWFDPELGVKGLR